MYFSTDALAWPSSNPVITKRQTDDCADSYKTSYSQLRNDERHAKSRLVGSAVDQLVADLNGGLFAAVLSNDQHVLHRILPERNTQLIRTVLGLCAMNLY